MKVKCKYKFDRLDFYKIITRGNIHYFDTCNVPLKDTGQRLYTPIEVVMNKLSSTPKLDRGTHPMGERGHW